MQPKIAVGIPTSGRSSVLEESIKHLKQQIRRPDRIIVCCASLADVSPNIREDPEIEVIFANCGLPIQRNAILKKIPECDLVVFFDDDFLAGCFYLQEIENVFERNLKVGIVTGRVIADGVNGPGISIAHGREILAKDLLRKHDRTIEKTFGGYGCNMVLRMSIVRKFNVYFDERLPLYGWQEDNDLSRRFAAFGDIVRSNAARGVHLGVKSGRTSGMKLGYSQVANPLYIWHKHRTNEPAGYTFKFAFTQISKNFLANTALSLRPEPYIDRRGRLRGNLVAFKDLIFRRMVPERILEF